MKNKVSKSLLFLCMILFLSGCGKEEVVKVAGEGITDSITENKTSSDENINAEQQTATDVNNAEVASLKEDDIILGDFLKNEGTPVFSYKDILPIIVNGDTVAFATINQLERIGIADWYNSKAIEKNIKHSYSLNMSIKNKADKVLSVTVTPTLINKRNTKVSSCCNVGWTGFGETAEFYGKGEIPIEVGFQPEISNEKGLRLQLVFETSEGTSEPIIISNKIFSNVVKGPKLKESGDKTNITSINGAKYSFTISKVYKELNLMDLDEKTAIEFDNTIKYISALKVKKKQVDTFDPKKNYAMYTSLKIGMQTQHNPTLRYKHDETAIRKDYYSKYTDTYASTLGKTLKVGKSVRYHLNRTLGKKDASETFVRFCVEFPEEAKAASLEDMLNFNGRFIVYQCETHNREIKYEGISR